MQFYGFYQEETIQSSIYDVYTNRSNFCSQEIVRYSAVQLKSGLHFPKAVFRALFPCLIFTYVWVFLDILFLHEHSCGYKGMAKV